MATPPVAEAPPKESEDEAAGAAAAAAAATNNATQSDSNAAASVASPRENFLRRLELQQQQQQTQQPQKTPELGEEAAEKKSSPEANVNVDGGAKVAEKTAAEGKSSHENRVVDSVSVAAGSSKTNNRTAAAATTSPPLSAPSNNSSSPPPQQEEDRKPPARKKAPPQMNQSVGDQLLCNYLSQFCDHGSSASSSNTGAPSDWIKDVDPSSLALLKGLAGIKDKTSGNFINGTPGSSPFQRAQSFVAMGRRASSDMSSNSNLNNANTNNGSIGDTTTNPSSDTPFRYARFNKKNSYRTNQTIGGNTYTVVRPGPDEATQTWEVVVPPHAVPGEPFHIRAGKAMVRVICPVSAKAGHRIRFTLPVTYYTRAVVDPPLPPLPTDATAAASASAGTTAANTTAPAAAAANTTTATTAPPPVESRAGLPSEDDAVGKPKDDGENGNVASGTGSNNNSNGNDNNDISNNNIPAKNQKSDHDIQNRMLSIIERQQSQMQEMQARLDALGGMMAQMEQDVQYLRQTTEGGGQFPPQQQQQRGRGGAPVGSYRMFGGLFGGGRTEGGGGQPQPQPQPQPVEQSHRDGVANAEAMPEAPEAMPGPVTNPNPSPAMQRVAAANTSRHPRPRPAQQRPRQTPPQQTPPAPGRDAAPGAPPPRRADPQQQQPPAANAAPAPQQHPLHQGIFFPLFVFLFRFLLSLPGRLRSLLLSSGPGRVYAHLRNRARERNAFANVDLASLVKLLVMLLIFTGRVGRDSGDGRNMGGGRRRNNRANENNNANNNNNAEEDDSLMAYMQSLLQMFIEYWNGHRVHTLVLASMIAFLIQTGLMGFLYEVLWVERGEIWRAWLGRQGEEVEEGEQNDDLAGGNNGEGGEGNGPGDGAAAAGDANGNANQGGANGPNARPANAPARAPAAPPAAGGGMIRRGPNNGGFFHDIQCLVLSFLLSLIPAWRPEAAAQPQPAAEETAAAEDAGGPEPGPEEVAAEAG